MKREVLIGIARTMAPSHLNLAKMFGRAVLCFAASFLLPSCASVKVDENTVSANATLRKPTKVYVAPFDNTKGIWNVDRDGAELELFKKNAALELQRMMVERFPEIAPTFEAPATLPHEGLLIAGEFTRINQGSRALRIIIGFGAGGTKVETNVRLYNLSVSSTTPVAEFKTTGGSNAQPGFIAGGWLTAPLYAGLNSTGLQADWERTSREIRNFILEKTGDYKPDNPSPHSNAGKQNSSRP